MGMEGAILHPAVAVLAVGYGLAGLLWTAFRSNTLRSAGLALFGAAFALNTWILASRWIESDRPPFKTLYETLLFYPWCVSLVTFILIAMHGLRVLVPFAALLNVVGLAYGLYRPDVEVVNLPPALQSGWFVPHVVTYFVSYATLFASCVFASLSLVAHRRGPDGEADARRMASSADMAVRFGFSALSLGLVLGAVWGKVAWGDYWTWDPKENWALITWLLYLIYLHLRFAEAENEPVIDESAIPSPEELHLRSSARQRRAMILCASCFAAVVFTYLGMSLLPTAEGSLHVYQ